MKKILDLDDIERIRKDPLYAAKRIQEMGEDIECILSSLEHLTRHGSGDPTPYIHNLIYNYRQRYQKA